MPDISVSIEECPVDATLAEDVLNESGMVVLKAGTVLAENKLASLSRYGITDLVIKDMSTLSPQEIAEKKEKIEKQIIKRMRRCEMTDEMIELKNMLVNYHCRDL